MILNSKDRSMHDLQFQTLYWGYVKNKYNRKVSKIPSDFYDLMQVNKILLSKKKLFVINTSIRNYSPAVFEREKMILERLFPTKTKYELDGDEDNIVKIFPKIIDSINFIFIGDWGLGIGDWAQSPIPNPQSPY